MKPPPSIDSQDTIRSRLLRALERSPHEPYTGSSGEPERPAEPAEAVESFSGKVAADVVGISYRQLDYWARTDLIRPSLAVHQGSSTRRRYSYRDLIELKLVKTLLDNGITLENIREAFGYLRDHLGEDLSTTKLVIAGDSAILVRENDELVDVVNRYQGQGVLNLLALDGVQSQVDAALVKLFPPDEKTDSSASETPPSDD